MPNRKTLKELYVDGRFTEDRAVRKEELQWHCEEVCDDQEETTEKPKGRISQNKSQCDNQFAKERRIAEIIFDLLLRARTRMAEGKVNGPEDSVVTKTIKELFHEKICEITKCFQARFMDQEDSENCAINFLEDARC